jgi:probable phosphoglycerate mutase
VLRAIETSVILANQLGVEYEIIEALREYDCGILEGRSDEGAWQRWKELFDAWVVRQEWGQKIEGGESFYDIRARFEPFIKGLVNRFGWTETDIVCVAHAGLYWMMLPVVLKNVNWELISRYGFEFTTCIVAEWRPEGLFCVDWNGHGIEAPVRPS